MVKFERKMTASAQKAIRSLADAKRRGSTYNTSEVNAALEETFKHKCYLCETKNPGSIEIEHLVPHGNDPDLKYDWNNLYLSCRHCNNTKGQNPEPILDCCENEIDKMIAFRREGFFGIDEQFQFTPVIEDEKVRNTCKLLHNVYYGTTPQKKLEAVQLRRNLRKELSCFKETVREYQEETGEEKEDILQLLQKELRNGSNYTAFKRWLIRDNAKKYPDLMKLIEE